MQALLRDIARFILAYARWVASFRRIWVALGVVALVGLMSALIPAKSEDQIRYCGLALQLLGVGTVVALLRDKTTTFGRLGALAYLRERFAARPRFRPAKHVISVSGVASSSAVGSVHASVWRTPVATATVEERLGMLEANAESLRRDLEWHTQQARQSTERLQSELQAEREARRTAVTVVEQRLERFGAGSLHIEAAGLFWLITGIVLATIPGELAKLFGFYQ